MFVMIGLFVFQILAASPVNNSMTEESVHSLGMSKHRCRCIITAIIIIVMIMCIDNRMQAVPVSVMSMHITSYSVQH